MIKSILRTYYPIIFSLLIFLPSIGNFFSSDDWFHLRITQITSFQQFLNFFSFSHTAQSAAFYRPLSTQVFFYIFQSLFGLVSWSYYLFVLCCFGYSLYLLYQFAIRQLNSHIHAKIAVLIYGVSVSNFTRIYFLSAFQEISLVIFSLLSLLYFPKSKVKGVMFFVLALLSKETAIILPILLLIFNYRDLKKNTIAFLWLFTISLIYLFFRFKVFGLAVGDSYLWNLSPYKAANTLMWYILWSFGAPELLVDYVGSGLKLVPKFYTDYLVWWKSILIPLFGTLLAATVLVVKKFKEVDTRLLSYVFFFLISISPVLFLPSHKFALELGLPLVGFSLAIAWLFPKKLSILSYIFLSFYLILNILMNCLTYTRHYSVSRGEISSKVYSYLVKNYPSPPEFSYFEFINDTEDYGPAWGQSKQISQALSGSDFFRVFYRSPGFKVYYQDILEERPSPLGVLPIDLSTKQFLTK